MRKTPAILFTTMCIGANAHALDFNLIYDSSINAQALAGFQAAAARWSNAFSNSMTVNLNIGYASLGSGILGQTGSSSANYSYTSVKSALTSGATSSLDFAAVAGLDAGSSYSYVTNGTNNGSGLHTTTTTDSTVNMTNSNAKALGIYAGASNASDASITFSSNFSFDFNPSDGITTGQYDFVGVATHEIGHALGFISGVDVLDGNFNNANLSDAYFNPYHSTLDLFRYSTVNGVATRSFAAGTASYFSNGLVSVTGNPAFATGTRNGDGSQASHWKDNLGLGIMDPTAAPGELLAISQNDLNAFDAIGYNLRTQATPEPATFAALGLGIAAFLRRRKRA